jgi:Heparinase II/III-like protein
MKSILKCCLTALFFLSSFSIHAQKGLLAKRLAGRDVADLLLPASKWVTYPAYADRAGWDKLTGSRRAEIIKDAEKFLNYEWKVVKATDYLAFERTGNRDIMQNPFGQNNTALGNLFMAELAEGEGRFLDQIINGVWHTCEMSTWVLSAHLPVQRSKRSLPDIDETIIDLTSGDISSMMSWIHYFMSGAFDKVNPVISARIRKEVKSRMLDPYLQRSDFWWMALTGSPDQMVNNWNPWCNFNALTSFLLMESDPKRRAEGVKKSIISTEKFIDYTKDDGACEEGPSYWGHAAGKMYDYLQILSYATGGNVDIFQEPKIRNMGEYIARSYIGDGWVVNFADASAKGGGNASVIHRYGKAVGSPEMMSFAAYLDRRSPHRGIEERDLFRALEGLQYDADLDKSTPAMSTAAWSWYPQTEFCYMRAGDTFFGAKGGYNAESHNHNDVGSFVYFVKTTPIFVDAGVGTYTKFTFSSQRYNIWTMQSDYHNLPMINGVSQKDGRSFRSRQVSFDSTRSTLSLDIAGAYPSNASVKSWKVDYAMSADGSLEIRHGFELSEAKAANRLNYLCAVQPEMPAPGVIRLKNGNASVEMTYDAKAFEPSVEKVAIDDVRLSRVWGEALYRLTLKALKSTPKGKYKISVKPV